MNRSELVQAVSRKTKIRNDVVDEVLEAVVDMVMLSLAVEEPVKLRGFGKFEPRARPAVRLKHPQTGDPLDIEVRKTVVFLPSPNLKDRLNSPPLAR